MATEQFANDADTTLNGAIDGSQTTLVVTDASRFPADGQFRIVIDSEIILVTGVSGTTFTITRAREGTVGGGHSDLAPVSHRFTAGAIEQFRVDNSGAGAIGSQPTAGIPGRLYIPNDGLHISRDDGTNFVPFGPLYKFKQTQIVSDFTWVNQSTATATDQGGLIYMTAPLGSGNNLRILKQTAPSPPYVITAAFKVMADISNGRTMVGLCFRNSGSSKCALACLEFTQVTGTQVMYVRSVQMTDNTTEAGDYIKKLLWINIDAFWLRIEDDNTNRNVYLSSDGINFTLIHQVGRTDFLTADEFGFFTDAKDTGSNVFPSQVHLLSWEQT